MTITSKIWDVLIPNRRNCPMVMPPSTYSFIRMIFLKIGKANEKSNARFVSHHGMHHIRFIGEIPKYAESAVWNGKRPKTLVNT